MTRKNKGKRKQKKLYCGESDLNDISKRTRAKTNIIHQSQSDNSDSDDSDNEPLVNCVSQNWTSSVKNNSESDSDNSSNDSDEHNSEPLISHRLRSSHDENSQSSSRPIRQINKRNLSSRSWQHNISSEDEQPSHSRTKSATTPNPLRSIRKKRPQTSSESENQNLAPRSSRAKQINYRKMLEFSDDSNAEETSPRSTLRRGKRPIHYNEDSDNDNNSESNNGRHMRKRRHVSHNENDDSDNDRSNQTSTSNVISISSRGRIRKLTARAKAFLRD